MTREATFVISCLRSYLVYIVHNFYKGDNFCDFQVAFLIGVGCAILRETTFSTSCLHFFLL